MLILRFFYPYHVQIPLKGQLFYKLRDKVNNMLRVNLLDLNPKIFILCFFCHILIPFGYFKFCVVVDKLVNYQLVKNPFK